jgi:hypothetical protein
LRDIFSCRLSSPPIICFIAFLAVSLHEELKNTNKISPPPQPISKISKKGRQLRQVGTSFCFYLSAFGAKAKAAGASWQLAEERGGTGSIDSPPPRAESNERLSRKPHQTGRPWRRDKNCVLCVSWCWCVSGSKQGSNASVKTARHASCSSTKIKSFRPERRKRESEVKRPWLKVGIGLASCGESPLLFDMRASLCGHTAK